MSIVDHRLIGVVGRHIFEKPSDFLVIIPGDLSDPFSTKHLADAINQPRWLAQKMAYCLRNMGAIDIVGKDGKSILYSSLKGIGEGHMHSSR